MKKLLTLMFAIIGTIIASAQDSKPLADFTLLESGNFVSAENHEQNFIVIPFEGKSAQEIYQMLMTNAALVVNNPDKQVSGVEYSVVKVNATQHLLTDVVMMLPMSCTGTMYYEFQIKDGRVRVNAPYVGKPCHYGTSDNLCYFDSVVKGYFKKGKLKDKKAAEFNGLIAKTNKVINLILGIMPNESKNEDW